MININIAKDFSRTPGARHKGDGKFSGEEFREEILLPKYKEAINAKDILMINLDGCYGYATSFLEESFGGLVRETQKSGILKNIQFISNDDISLTKLIEKYVNEAEKLL